MMLINTPKMDKYFTDVTLKEITNIYNSLESKSYEHFRIKILRETGVSFCTREHFGTPLSGEDRKYIRFAYSGISVEKIDEGMKKLKQYLSHNNVLVSL